MSAPNFAAAQQALTALAGQRAALERAIETGARRREELVAAPLPRSDVLAVILGQIEAMSREVPVQLEKAAGLIAGHPGRKLDRILWLPSDPDGLGRFVAAMMGPTLAEGIRKAFDRLPEDPNAGPPIAERTAQLAKIDRELDRATAELEQLRTATLAAGLPWTDRGLYE